METFKGYVRTLTRLDGKELIWESETKARVTERNSLLSVRYVYHSGWSKQLQEFFDVPVSVVDYRVNRPSTDYMIIAKVGKRYVRLVCRIFQLENNAIAWNANVLDETNGWQDPVNFSTQDHSLFEKMKTEFLNVLQEDPKYRLWLVTNSITHIH